jgi:hypothetical protein
MSHPLPRWLPQTRWFGPPTTQLWRRFLSRNVCTVAGYGAQRSQIAQRNAINTGTRSERQGKRRPSGLVLADEGDRLCFRPTKGWGAPTRQHRITHGCSRPRIWLELEQLAQERRAAIKAREAIEREVREAVRDLHARGATPSQLANVVGVTRATIHNWLKRP